MMLRLIMLICILLLNANVFAALVDVEIPVHFKPYNDSVVFASAELIHGSNIQQKYLYREGDVLSNKFLVHHTGLYDLEITVTLASGRVLTDNAKGYFNSLNETRKVNGAFNASCFETIFTVYWLLEKEISESDLFGKTIDTTIMKRYDIPEADMIADAFYNEGLKWYDTYAVNYEILDSNFIPLIKYGNEYYRNPVTTSQMVFAFHNQYLNFPDSICMKGFLANANWLVENNQQGYYLYDFDFSHYVTVRMKKYWVSAMAQGYALGALSYAYFITKDKRYLIEADSVFQTLHNNSPDYWSVLLDDKGYYWLEEYPSSIFCHVLNGKMAALWGIFQYYAVTKKTLALRLLEAGIKTILDNYYMWNIPNQDRSYYCLHKQYKANYHDLHKRQMLAFANRFHLNDFYRVNECFSNSPTIIENNSIAFDFMPDSNFTYVNSPWEWQLKESCDWLSAVKYDTLVMVKVESNSTLEKRNACVELLLENGDSDTILVTQYARDFIKAEKYLIEMDASGDTLNVAVSTNLQNYDLSCGAKWLRVDTFGNIIQLAAAENSGFEPRSSTLKAFLGKHLLTEFKVFQHASIPYINIPFDSVRLKNDREIVLLDVSTNIDTIQLFSYHNWISNSWDNDSTVRISTKHNVYEDVTGVIYFDTDYLTKELLVSCKYDPFGVVGFDNEKATSAFKVFPNPAHSNLWIIEEEKSEIIYYYRLTNVYGVELTHGSFTGSVNLDVSDYSKGLYLLTVSKEDTVCFTNRIVVY